MNYCLSSMLQLNKWGDPGFEQCRNKNRRPF